MIDSSSPGPPLSQRARRLQLALTLATAAAALLPSPWFLLALSILTAALPSATITMPACNE